MAMTAEPIVPLRLTGVGYRIGGVRLLADISCELGAAGPTVILGPNGAGKSLLLRICHGLMKPSEGHVQWNAMPADLRFRHALVFQSPVLLRRSVQANLDHALRLRGLPRDARQRRIDEVLGATGLTAHATRSARVLSGGEQQRLALARAWAGTPEVMFLDEPTASLDPAGARAVEELIRIIHASGTRLVLTTHDLGLARRLAHEVLFLEGGRLGAAMPAAAFFANPPNQAAAAFLRGELWW